MVQPCSQSSRPRLGALLVLLLAPALASAQLVTGSDGTDGPFNPPASNVEIDLGLAPTVSSWTVPGTGNGVYDPNLWAVVFKYSSVNIPGGAQIRFKNHPSRAPVVWLVDGTVTIAGSVNLNGSHAGNHGMSFINPAAPSYTSFAEPGPGGFRGGIGSVLTPGDTWLTSSGLGPGGGYQQQDNVSQGHWGAGASHASQGQQPYMQGPISPTYGNPAITQLVGGSGGAAYRRDSNGTNAPNGGGGGGAILIAANQSINVTAAGVLRARGGAGWEGWSGAGSGGSIRLVANAITIAGSIWADADTNGYDGSFGRIRLESHFLDLPGYTTPPYTDGPPGVVLPGDPLTIEITRIGSVSVLSDPLAGLGQGSAGGAAPGVSLPASGQVQVEVTTTNVLPSWNVFVRVTSAAGQAQEFAAPALVPTGNPNEHVTTVFVDLIDGYTAIQARAAQP